MTVVNYEKVDCLEIEVNNKNKIKVELIKTNQKYGQYMKMQKLDENGNKEKTVYINEGDLVLFWNLYINRKENFKEIY